MTSLSLSECCHLLAIDPKTLRQWLVQAQMSLHTHPTDARIKCLTSEQVHVLASLHDQVLALPVAALDASTRPDEAESRTPPTTLSDADLRARLVQMEHQVATLQAQLTNLALQLLQEREQRTEQRLLTLETLLPLTKEHALASLPRSVLSASDQPAISPLACHPAEKRNRLIPLIEYGARGRYVLICPEEGELHITSDSPEWFAWLATLNSFRFVGRQGRLSTYRNPGRACWMPYRRIHGHRYEYALGHTEHLTIDRLEQMAATLQSHAPSL
jgi:hypothetical protein